MWHHKVGVQTPAFSGLGDLCRRLLIPFTAQASSSRATKRPKVMYRDVCMVTGPQEAFDKCLLAKQELHRAVQKTSSKIRIKPQFDS